MEKLLPQDFFDRHPLLERSEFRTQYDLLKSPLYFEQSESLSENSLSAQKDQQTRSRITKAKTPEKLMIYLRYSLLPETKKLLFDTVLARENEIMPLLLSKLLYTAHFRLINNVAYLMLHTQMDYCPWLMQNLHKMQCPYAQSIFCLVLGIRGNENAAFFLFHEAKHMKEYNLDKRLQQGPLLALYEMKSRFPDL